MGKRQRKKRDTGTVIFRIIGIEVLVLAIVFIILGVVFLPGILNTLESAGMISLPWKRQVPSVQGGAPADPGPQEAQQTPAAPAASTPAATEPEEAIASVKLAAVGDNLMHRSGTLSGQRSDGTYSYYDNFCNMQDVFHTADLAVISQDTVMAGMEYGVTEGEVFNTGLEIGSFMVDAGINVVLAANNHILDHGKEGLGNMINYWRGQQPQTLLLGVNLSQEEKDTPVYFEKNGIKLALVNYTSHSNVTEPLGSEPYLLNMEDEAWLTSIITKAEQEADFTIVFPHWGTQNSMEVTQEQSSRAQFLADLGADLIIGAYPHVVEPVKWIRGKDGNETLVYYSLGNFQSIQDQTRNMLGALANVTITKTNRRTYISDCGIDFVVTHFAKQNTTEYFDVVTTFPWSQYNEELAAQHGIVAWDPTFSYSALSALREEILAGCELKK